MATHGGFRVARNGVKRSKISVLPEVHTFHASEVTFTILLSDLELTDLFRLS